MGNTRASQRRGPVCMLVKRVYCLRPGGMAVAVAQVLVFKTHCSGVGVVANGQNALCTLLGMATADFVTIGGSSSIRKFNWRAILRTFRSCHQSCGPQQQRQQRQPAVAPDARDSFAPPPFDHLPHPPSCPRLATSRQANQTYKTRHTHPPTPPLPLFVLHTCCWRDKEFLGIEHPMSHAGLSGSRAAATYLGTLAGLIYPKPVACLIVSI